MKCEFCGNEESFSKEYNTYYCDKCNVWLESECDDPDCDFCLTRPQRPLFKAVLKR
jgi:hypothetical protein